MKVLVTGGAGFIGSHASEKLLAAGHQVAVIDDLNDFYAPQIKRANLEAVQARGAQFFEGDIRDQALLERLFSSFAPDLVLHLAARAGVRPSLADPLLYESVNVRGTLELLEASRRHGTRRFVFASSSSVYGIADRVPFREDDSLNLPISPYAATKLAAEKMCFAYSHLYGFKIVCLRFFTVFGPRQRPDLAIHKFARSIAAGRPIPVFGDGTSGRDYTYVEDTVRGILAACDYDCPFDVFNLGNSHPITLNEMIASIERAVGKTAIIERLPDQPGDVPITYADISKAERLLGYTPRISFDEGVRRFVEWIA